MRIGWIGLFICLACSCRYIGPVDGIFFKNLKARPDSSLLIGTWEVDDLSYDLIKQQYKLGNRHVLLQFFKSGEFQARNMPDFVTNGFGKSPNGKMPDATGKWEMDPTEDGWGLSLKFNPGELFPTGTYTVYDLYLKNGKLVIWNYIGDPDEANRLLYKKVK